MHRVFWLAALLLSVIMLMASPIAAAAPPLQAGNRLQNGNFEAGFTQRGAGEVVVATGWEPWWQRGTQDQDANGFLKRPEYKPDSSRAPGTQQKFFNNYATHNGGIYQRVSVPWGSKLTFTARVYVWSSQQDGFGTSSNAGNYATMIGIDPTGGNDPLAGSVVWSPSRIEYDHWVDHRLDVTAQRDVVTVFLRGTVEYRVKNNNSYWDDAVLTAAQPAPTSQPPTATSQPTATSTNTPTPLPTSTPTDTPPPTNTPPPTDTPVPTFTPTSTDTPTPPASPTPEAGSLCVVAYEDTNENGRQDPEERLLAARRIRLMDAAGNQLAEYTTDGQSEPYCFEGLVPGAYQLVKQALITGGTTTMPVSVAGGETATLAFGDLAPPTSTPDPSARPTPRPASSFLGIGGNIYRLSGILVLVLAAGIALGYTLLQRQL